MKLHLSISSRAGTRGASRDRVEVRGRTVPVQTIEQAKAFTTSIRSRSNVLLVKAVVTEVDEHGKIITEIRI